jgi:hypothetical protein
MALLKPLLLAAASAGLAVSCDGPTIDPGTYFCGPNQLCPPHLMCEPNTFTCERPDSVIGFVCPDDNQSSDRSDDELVSALGLGTLSCGQRATRTRCVEDQADQDYLFVRTAPCLSTNPHLQIELRYPVANAELTVDALDDKGQVIASGRDCTPPQNFTGMAWACIDLPGSGRAVYLRVRATGRGTCGGRCGYNHYELLVSYPPS